MDDQRQRKEKNQHRVLTLSLLMVTLFLTGNRVRAACDACSAIRQDVATHEQNKKTKGELLEKNKEMLGKLDPSERSKAIKFRGNIAMISIQIETAENELQALAKASQDNSCATCP